MDTLHFNESEFKCRHCGEVKPSQHLMAVLELVRMHFSQPVTVNSSYRCEEHNAAVGGAKNSKHKLGIAADIVVKGIEPKLVYQLLDSVFPNSYGLGLYEKKGFVHVDVRPNKARWKG